MADPTTMDTSGSQDKKAVPKFSSFKAPLATSEADRAAGKQRRHDHRSRSPRRSKEHYRYRSPSQRSHTTRHNRSHSPLRDRRTSRERQTDHNRTWRDETGRKEEKRHPPAVNPASSDLSHLKSEELYVIDTEGDRSVLKYGTAHRYDIPLYRRAGEGQVLGLPENLAIDREHAESDTIVLRDKNAGSQKHKFPGPLSGPVKQPTQLYRLRQDANPPATEELKSDTILLEYPIEKASGVNTVESDSDDERFAYRSILGKAKTEDVLPKDMELVTAQASNNEEHQVSLDAERRARNAKLSHNLACNPKDVASWLELIDNQSALVLGPGEDDRHLTSAECKSVADMRLSLYDKALVSCGDTVHKELLVLGRLQEGGHLWDRKQFFEEWEKTLGENPDSMSLWLKYLNLRQTDFQDFAVDDCKSLLVNCMKRIDASPHDSRYPQVQCYLLLRLTLLLREAGYTELAVGLWQAVLEFTCFRPDAHSEGQRDTALAQFCEFWDSEVARLGELKGHGWRSDKNHKVDPVTRPLSAHVDVSSLVSSWTSSERILIQNLKMPARSLDIHGVNVDTAYSVVLTSDLLHILPSFWHAPVPDDIVNAFLYFCHLPHLTREGNAQTTRLWDGDNFLRNESLDTIKGYLSEWLPPGIDASQTTFPPFSFPVTSFLHTPETLFAPENWFYSLQSWSTALSGQSHTLDTDWVRRTLQSLAERFHQDDDLAEYALAVAFACDRRAATKFAKSLLNSRRSSFKLYNAFALMQCRLGAQDFAYQVWSQVINDNLNCGPLWNTWAWEMLRQGDISRTSHLLHTMLLGKVDLTAFHAATEQKEYSPFDDLRLQKILRRFWERALAEKMPHVYVAYIDCLALLQYISAKSLDTALDVYVSGVLNLGHLSDEEETFKAFTSELLHQARARLIYFHVSQRGQFQPRRVQILWEESVKLFPLNTMFRALHMWNQSRCSFLDRIRPPPDFEQHELRSRYKLDPQSSVSPIVVQKIPVTLHLFNLYVNFCRPTFAGGNLHTVRAAFETSLGEHADRDAAPTDLGDYTARSNITIWKLYFLFELDRAQDIKAAKSVLLRAIVACPWSKELVMLAFERLGCHEDGLTFSEFRGLYDSLEEKQARIHVKIEEELREVTVQRAAAQAQADAWLNALGAQMEGVEMG